MKLTFLGLLWLYEKNNQSGFIGIGSVNISEQFDMMESMDLMDLQVVHKMPFYKN